MKRTASLSEILKPLSEKPNQAYLSNAVQVADILEWVLQQVGVAEVWQTSFSISEEFLRRLFFICKANKVSRINLVLDHKATNKTLKLWAPNNEMPKQSSIVVERLKHIRPGQNAFTANLPEHLRLKVKGAKISQIYKRLDPNKVAYTVTGSGGGGTHIYHWSENRALTNRERARLQTFPDSYVFQGSKESVRKQIGMAVPCQGAKIIFEAVLKTFAGIEYDYVEP